MVLGVIAALFYIFIYLLKSLFPYSLGLKYMCQVLYDSKSINFYFKFSMVTVLCCKKRGVRLRRVLFCGRKLWATLKQGPMF